MADKRTNPGYLPGIDGLRAVAVVSVIIFHLRAGYLPGGFNGVDMFYAISGFVVTLSLVDKKFGSFGEFLSFFYACRLLRIMPALVVALLATFTLAALFIPEAWIGVNTRATGIAAFAGVSNIVLALNNDTYFSPATSLNPFTHTWSLGVEEQFYLLFPFLMYWRQVRLNSRPHDAWSMGSVVGLSVLSFAACGALTLIEQRFAFYLIPSRFWELGLGMVLCLSMPRWKNLPESWRTAIGLLSIAAIVTSLVLGESTGFPFPLALLPVLGTLGLICNIVAAPSGRIAQILATQPVVVCGKLSYSLYLWHWPVTVLLRWTTGLESWWTQALAIGLTCVLGWASYAFVEVPFRHGFKTAPRGPLILAIAGIVAALASGAYLESRFTKYLTLSVTRNHADWYAEAKPVKIGPGSRCGARLEKSSFMQTNVRHWIPEGCGVSARRVFVLGDSHALAIAPALARLSADHQIEVTAYSRTGCGFLTLNQPLSSTSDCEAYGRALVSKLNATLRPGDIVWLETLRMPRFVDQDGTFSQASLVDPAQRSAATKEAIGILQSFSKHGAAIILPLPMPVLPSLPYRCSDWFNRNNPICQGGPSISRAMVESIRAPVIQQMRDIAAKVPAVELWDPLPILCQTTSCTALRGGRPVFFDGDHLSGYGNTLLYPAMEHIIMAADTKKGEPLQKGRPLS